MREWKPWYDVLGVSPTATSEEIRLAYRTLVKTWHPDQFAMVPEHAAVAEERLKAINAAYEQARFGAWPSPYGESHVDSDWPEWYETVEPARVRLLFVPNGAVVRAIALMLALVFLFLAVAQTLNALDLIAGK
jgi:hypothetical protein